MVNDPRVIRDESGMILVSVLLILCLLMAVIVGSVTSVHNDYRMVHNLRGGTAALYLADSGVEWAKEQIGATTTLPLALTDRALNLSTGSFAAVFTGAAQPGPLTGQVVVRATGSAGNATQTVQARITKRYDLADAALVLRGEARSVNFVGSAFVFDGRDHEVASRLVLTQSKPGLGLSVGSAALFSQINSGLSEVQLDNVAGAQNGRSAIVRSPWLGADSLAQLANGVCSAPGTRTTVVPALTNLTLSGVTLGSRGVPEAHCFDGPVDSSSTVMASGTLSGAGLLVVRNAELVLSSNFSWEGVVLVTGRNVGVRIVGSDSKEIVGSLVVNETGSLLGSGPALVDVQGHLRLLYSRQAHEFAAMSVPNVVLQNAYSYLPYRLIQDYWRMVSL